MENRELLHLFSILLQYPDAEWVEADLENELASISLLNPDIHQRLVEFVHSIKSMSLEELQDVYVQTFDFNEKTNLYLSYSKMKEERERGIVLVELKQVYEQAGFVLDSDELPDYLPLFLEFIAIASDQDIKKLLPPFLPAIEKLEAELAVISSPYFLIVQSSYIILNQILQFDSEQKEEV